MDHGGEDHLDGRLGHRSKSVCAGLACCCLGWTVALSVMTVLLKVV